MKCEDIKNKLTSYLLGDLDKDEKVLVEKHLEECEGCRAELDEIEPTLDLLRAALAVPSVSHERLSDVKKAEVIEESTRKESPKFNWWITRSHPRLAMAASVALVLGFMWIVARPVLQKSSVSLEDGYVKLPQKKASHELDEISALDEAPMLEEIEEIKEIPPSPPEPVTQAYFGEVGPDRDITGAVLGTPDVVHRHGATLVKQKPVMDLYTTTDGALNGAHSVATGSEVPVLGGIPIQGRLFRSEVTKELQSKPAYENGGAVFYSYTGDEKGKKVKLQYDLPAPLTAGTPKEIRSDNLETAEDYRKSAPSDYTNEAKVEPVKRGAVVSNAKPGPAAKSESVKPEKESNTPIRTGLVVESSLLPPPTLDGPEEKHIKDSKPASTKKIPLKYALPDPLFEGTPKNIKTDNLEPAGGYSRVPTTVQVSPPTPSESSAPTRIAGKDGWESHNQLVAAKSFGKSVVDEYGFMDMAEGVAPPPPIDIPKADSSDIKQPPTDFSPMPAEFDSVAIVKSPVIMKNIYGSRSPGARGAALKAFGGGGGGSLGNAEDKERSADKSRASKLKENKSGKTAYGDEVEWNATPNDVNRLLKDLATLADVNYDMETKASGDNFKFADTDGDGMPNTLEYKNSERNRRGKSGLALTPDEPVSRTVSGTISSDTPVAGDINSFAAQGKSSNEAPDHKEQDGRSNIGRQGMSAGETAAGSGTVSEDVFKVFEECKQKAASESMGFGDVKDRELGKREEYLEGMEESADRMSELEGWLMDDGEDDAKSTGGGKLSAGKVDEMGLIGGAKRMDSNEEMEEGSLGSLKAAANHLRQSSDDDVVELGDKEDAKRILLEKRRLVLEEREKAQAEKEKKKAAKDLEREELTGPVFKAWGVNNFVATDVNPLSTFAIDVDTAAYTVMRNYASRGLLPPAEAVRTEEFVNFFDYAYNPPRNNTFAIHADVAPSKFGRGKHMLKLGITGRKLGREEQRQAVVTLLIDTSGSMDQPDRMGLVKKSLRMLLERLDPRDQVAIVQYSSEARLVMEHTSAANKDEIIKKIDSLKCSGSTNLEKGMGLAYGLASSGFVGGGENRVIILSDGAANLGGTEADSILKKVEKSRKQGVFCSVLGFGMGTYNDVMLETLANKGDGTYSFIDSEDEARRVLVKEFSATLNTIARDVKIQVEFNKKRVTKYRQMGYENRQLKAKDFRNDAVDAGEVGSGQSVTALYELEIGDDLSEHIGIIRVRYRRADTGKVEEMSRGIKVGDLVKNFDDTDARFKLAACVAEYSEILRGSPFATGSDFEDVAKVLRPVALELTLDKRVQELLRIISAAESFGR